MDGQEQSKDLTKSHLLGRYSTMAEETKLTDLNDDCLECIFKLVQNLPNQIHIAMCCERFRDVMVNLWKRQLSHIVLDMKYLLTTLKNNEDLKFYLTAMRTEFLAIYYYGPKFQRFLQIVTYAGIKCFPCIQRFPIKSINVANSPCDVDKLSKLFFNLNYLEIPAPFTLRRTTTFEFLEELIVYKQCVPFTPTEGNGLREMIPNLKLLKVLDTCDFHNFELMPEISLSSKLEVLRLHMNTLKPLLNKVLQLPLLRELSVVFKDEFQTKELQQYVSQKGPQLQVMSLNFNFPQFWSPRLMVNLKTFALYDSIFDIDVFSDCHFKKLEILCLCGSYFRTTDILEMLSKCPVLKHLDISDCRFVESSIVEDIFDYWQRERPDEVLCLYYHHSAAFEEEIKKNYSFWSTQKHIRLTGDSPEWDFIIYGLDRKVSFCF